VRGTLLFRVKWKGYGIEQATNEPAENLLISVYGEQLLKEYAAAKKITIDLGTIASVNTEMAERNRNIGDHARKA